MGQKLIGHTLPAEAAHVDAMMDLGPDEFVLVLIKHCRDMKQQETCLRLISLLLLLSCVALFIFSFGADLWKSENSGSRGQGSAVEQSPASSQLQERVFPADDPQTNFQRLQDFKIHLRSQSEYNKPDGHYIKWDKVFGETYNEEKRAIMIPENGFYFIYLRFALGCHDEDKAANFTRFYVELRNSNEGYNTTIRLLEASDGIACTSIGFRSVFLGQLFDLSKGDNVSVWIGKGYKLINKASFGAFLV
ncbi:uncharacterized protein LOC115016975 [Cottoperca gobio]|uniref:Uncharacterized protein LOC115016975 n=1 Tax=Cottoperca gobio TaxID=56716 RepID=A0A6J2QUS8_COTGO|nr:uncharacterized protein LOC115016975 [Cottoperca gobio]